jgi:hypothetical protein
VVLRRVPYISISILALYFTSTVIAATRRAYSIRFNSGSSLVFIISRRPG